jgi:hypothetical protein
VTVSGGGVHGCECFLHSCSLEGGRQVVGGAGGANMKLLHDMEKGGKMVQRYIVSPSSGVILVHCLVGGEVVFLIEEQPRVDKMILSAHGDTLIYY